MGRIPASISLWLNLSLLLMSAATPIYTDSTAPIVNLNYAQYQGSYDAKNGLSSFLGIRYAAAPTGNLRFKAPQAPATVSGVQSATKNPNTCYQAGSGFGTSTNVPNPSEDCLFLNVYVPGTIPTSPPTSGGLPVLVWLHGGAYENGYAAQFNGGDLIAHSLNSVIVVIVQYRLGAFGFLAGNEVQAQGSLNAGLLDQSFALQWVQSHIASFGGNKQHVTIWGESAGGGSVLQHIVANGGNTQPPLFNAAITSSVCLPSQYDYGASIPQSMYDKVVSLAGCSSSSNTFTCLQSVNVKTLQSANEQVIQSAFQGSITFPPVVDGTFILERPSLTLAKGQVNGQALLAVNNQDEGNIFVNSSETLTLSEYIANLYPEMTSTSIQQAVSMYQSFGTAVEQAMFVIGESTFVCPTYYLLDAFSGRAWKGLFAVPVPIHSADLIYYFTNYDYGTPDPYFFNDTQFIDAFSQSFLSVAKNFDVNQKIDSSTITPNWNVFSDGNTEMLFNYTGAYQPDVVPITTDQGLLQRCAFWASVAAETAQ